MESSASPETPAVAPESPRPAGNSLRSGHCAVGIDTANKPRSIVESPAEPDVKLGEERVGEDEGEFRGGRFGESVQSEFLALVVVLGVAQLAFSAEKRGIGDDFAPEELGGGEERRDEGQLARGGRGIEQKRFAGAEKHQNARQRRAEQRAGQLGGLEKRSQRREARVKHEIDPVLLRFDRLRLRSRPHGLQRIQSDSNEQRSAFSVRYNASHLPLHRLLFFSQKTIESCGLGGRLARFPANESGETEPKLRFFEGILAIGEEAFPKRVLALSNGVERDKRRFRGLFAGLGVGLFDFDDVARAAGSTLKRSDDLPLSGGTRRTLEERRRRRENGDLEEGNGLRSVKKGNGARTGSENGEMGKRVGGGRGVFDGRRRAEIDGVEEEVKNVENDFTVRMKETNE